MLWKKIMPKSQKILDKGRKKENSFYLYVCFWIFKSGSKRHWNEGAFFNLGPRGRGGVAKRWGLTQSYKPKMPQYIPDRPKCFQRLVVAKLHHRKRLCMPSPVTTIATWWNQEDKKPERKIIALNGRGRTAQKQVSGTKRKHKHKRNAKENTLFVQSQKNAYSNPPKNTNKKCVENLFFPKTLTFFVKKHVEKQVV